MVLVRVVRPQGPCLYSLPTEGLQFLHGAVIMSHASLQATYRTCRWHASPLRLCGIWAMISCDVQSCLSGPTWQRVVHASNFVNLLRTHPNLIPASYTDLHLLHYRHCQGGGAAARCCGPPEGAATAAPARPVPRRLCGVSGGSDGHQSLYGAHCPAGDQRVLRADGAAHDQAALAGQGTGVILEASVSPVVVCLLLCCVCALANPSQPGASCTAILLSFAASSHRAGGPDRFTGHLHTCHDRSVPPAITAHIAAQMRQTFCSACRVNTQQASSSFTPTCCSCCPPARGRHPICRASFTGAMR